MRLSHEGGEAAWAKGALPAGISGERSAGVQIIEQIMEHVAEVSGVDPVEVRRLNFLKAYPVSQAPRVASTASTVLEGSSSTTEVCHAVLGSSSHAFPRRAVKACAPTLQALSLVALVLSYASAAVQGGHAMQRKEYGCSRLHQWPNPGPAFMRTSLGRWVSDAFHP